MFQTYSDDINITVPPISSHILQRNFNALLENVAHFVNIVGKWGSKLRLSTPALAVLSSFFFSSHYSINCHVLNLFR